MEGRKSIQKGQGNAPTVIPTAPPPRGGRWSRVTIHYSYQLLQNMKILRSSTYREEPILVQWMYSQAPPVLYPATTFKLDLLKGARAPSLLWKMCSQKSPLQAKQGEAARTAFLGCGRKLPSLCLPVSHWPSRDRCSFLKQCKSKSLHLWPLLTSTLH